MNPVEHIEYHVWKRPAWAQECPFYETESASELIDFIRDAEIDIDDMRIYRITATSTELSMLDIEEEAGETIGE